MVCGVLCLCVYVCVSVYAYVCMLGIKHEGVEEGINTNRMEERGEEGNVMTTAPPRQKAQLIYGGQRTGRG